MRPDREHPLYHLDAETLLVATYIWVGQPKATFLTPSRPSKPKASASPNLSATKKLPSPSS